VRALAAVIGLLALLGPVPYTAPQGDLNLDGAVDAIDLQCLVLLFDYTTAWNDFSPTPCEDDPDCQLLLGNDAVCREGPDGSPTCVPVCLSDSVLLKAAPPGNCSAAVPETDTCIGATWKRGADFDCDGETTVADFSFLVAIIMNKIGGTGTADIDNDGQLNFCDDDTDGDGTEDSIDCALTDPLIPSCVGKQCGDDGCGGSCGQCALLEECENFLCSQVPTGEFLVTDAGAEMIYRIDTEGSVINSFTSPVEGIRGIAHDLRSPLHCWVTGMGDQMSFYKLSILTGDVTAVVPNQIGADMTMGGMRGLSYDMRSNPAEDLLYQGLVNKTGIDTTHGSHVQGGMGAFKTAYPSPQGGFKSGYWGVAAYGAGQSERYASNFDLNFIERWDGSTFKSSFAIPVEEPRGLALGPANTFWVLDATTKKIYRVSAIGLVLSSLDAPGYSPMDISYWEG